LARRVGGPTAVRLTGDCRPVGAAEAVGLGLADEVGPADRGRFERWLAEYARRLASGPARARLVDTVRMRREEDELCKPLSAYRAEELAEMSQDMFADR